MLLHEPGPDDFKECKNCNDKKRNKNVGRILPEAQAGGLLAASVPALPQKPREGLQRELFHFKNHCWVS